MIDDRGDNLDAHDQLAVALSARATAARGVPMSDTLAQQYATQALLTLEESAAIVQRLAPPLRGALPGPTYIDEFQSEVGRLLHDVHHGHLPMPCKPGELVTWANAIAIELPPAFIAAVNLGLPGGAIADRVNASKDSARREAPDSANSEVTRVLNDDVGVAAPEAKNRSDWDPDLQARAELIAAVFLSKNGRHASKVEVSKKLAAVLKMDPASVERRIRNTWNQTKRGRRRTSTSARS